ncbi:hypothetical protein [Caulobacter sp. S45]|uniref:hypothetical protein n=1 Tax=Caulobacter sp. S45 TaxID=1641861 RepID=UPI001576B7B6|nr:hypothetical protein [Caulobacter sp. S45]
MSADAPVRGNPHDRLDVEDGLEPPTIRAGLMVAIAAGAIVFIMVSMILLMGFLRWRLANGGPDVAHVFPTPRLETSIDPRNMPSTPEPGPAPPVVRHPPMEPEQDLQRAMQAVVVRGEHAYDPVAASGNVAQ